MLRYIQDMDAKNISGGTDCGEGAVCAPLNANEQKPVNQGKSPTGTKPDDNSSTMSGGGSMTTHS